MKKIVKRLISVIVLVTTFAYVSPVYAMANKETVYSKLDSKGERYKTIVTTKEDEKISQDETEKELPIETEIKYELNGKEIKPVDLAGKSGKVKIKIEYKNKSAKEVIINGKKETMYTPFIVAVGAIIDNKNNKNIKVSDSGKVIENADKTVIVGIAFPGLDESLCLGGELEKLNIPSSIEITMDTKNFEISNILTYATPKILTKDIDWSKFDNLFDKVNELQNGINKIEDGAGKLQSGIQTLKDGAKTFLNGISKVYDGSKKLKSQVSNSVKAIENDKSKALDNKILKSIGKQAEISASKSIEKQLETIGNSAKRTAKESIKNKLDEIGNQAKNTAEAGIEAQKDSIAKNAETEAAKTLGNKETKNKVFSTLKTYIEQIMNSSSIQESIGSAAGNALSKEMIANIVKNATGQGVQVATGELDKIIANAGSAKEIKVSIDLDYQSSSDYKNLDDDAKKVVDSIAKQIKEDAESQAEIQAKDVVKYAKDNAEESAKKSAQEILIKATSVATQTAATSITSDMVSTATTAGVKEALDQLETVLKNNVDKISQKILPYVGEIAQKTAQKVAGEVAQSTAKETAKSLTPQLAEQIAKSVAKQIAPTVAGQTATNVADKVSTEVKNIAMQEIKSKMNTLLNDGISPLTDGIKQINDASKEFKGGTETLNNGAIELKTGINEFNTQGISKIAKFINVDMNNFITRGKKLEELADEYNKFNKDKEREDINFISLVDSIKNKKDE